jgi:hypothetical protein
MPPKKRSAGITASRNEPTEEDMLRMGMEPEQIATILASRGMTCEDKAKQNAEDKLKDLIDTKRKQYEKQHAGALAESETEEAAARGELYTAFRRGADAAKATRALYDEEAKERRRIEVRSAKTGLLAFWQVSPSIVQRGQAVTSRAAEYLKLWGCEAAHLAQLLIVAGGGHARIPTCESTMWQTSVTKVSKRALSLVGPRELWPLHVHQGGDFCALERYMDRKQKVLGSVCAVELAATGASLPDECASGQYEPRRLNWALAGGWSLFAKPVPEHRSWHGAAVDIIEQHAATITALAGPLPGSQLCRNRPRTCVLARCVRLESLTHASRYSAAVWLGLTQLHTLRDVDLEAVSFADMAAALPQLRTLTTVFRPTNSQVYMAGLSLVGFHEDLLLRLRVFHFKGYWPEGAATDGSSSIEDAPLPLLQELLWESRTAPRGFRGAQPTKLHAECPVIVQWLLAGGGPEDQATDGPLSRVRDLDVYEPTESSLNLGFIKAQGRSLNPVAVAQLLRAAPQLRTLTIPYMSGTPFLSDSDCGHATPTPVPKKARGKRQPADRERSARPPVEDLQRPPRRAPTDPAFFGLTHPRLQTFAVGFSSTTGYADCALRLQQLHFPRLRELRIVGDKSYFPT